MQLDLTTTPLSRYGSYLALSRLRPDRLALRDLRGGDDVPADIFWLEVYHQGQPVDFTERAEPGGLVLAAAEKGRIVLEFLADGTLAIDCQGLALRLEAIKSRYDSFYALGERTWRYDCYSKESKYLFQLPLGQLVVDAPWQRVGNSHLVLLVNPDDQQARLLLSDFRTEPGVRPDRTGQSPEFSAWRDQLLGSAQRHPAAADSELAAYLLWANTVHAAGRLSHDAVYMSKNRMQNIWSWDNAFIALALSRAYPELSFQQLDLFFQYQDESGVFPDFINDRFLSYNCCKPPVYGFFVRHLLARNAYFQQPAVQERLYAALTQNSAFWLQHRTLAAGTLPVYFHGNDSGWDNATIFAGGVPVEAPDLATFLVLQLETQARLADALALTATADRAASLAAAAVEHRAQAELLTARLLERLWNGHGFLARRAPGFAPIAERDSLILRLPLLLHERLPQDLVEGLVRDLALLFETDWGLASEAVASPLFEPEGYWRGPVWPAPMFLLITALREAGYPEMAARLREKFFQLVARGGMAENFQPQTGAGLSDTGFSWTAAVYLLLSEAD